jgi:hypothetical protein
MSTTSLARFVTIALGTLPIALLSTAALAAPGAVASFDGLWPHRTATMARPPLSGDPLQASRQELVQGGYPLRPDPAA